MCTIQQGIFSGIAAGGLVGTGIAAWKFVSGMQRESTIDKIREICHCPFAFQAPVANCTNDPVTYCKQLKTEENSLDGTLATLFCLTPFFLVLALGSLTYLGYSSYKAGGRVFTVIQNLRLKAGYEAIRADAENPAL